MSQTPRSLFLLSPSVVGTGCAVMRRVRERGPKCVKTENENIQFSITVFGSFQSNSASCVHFFFVTAFTTPSPNSLFHA